MPDRGQEREALEEILRKATNPEYANQSLNLMGARMEEIGEIAQAALAERACEIPDGQERVVPIFGDLFIGVHASDENPHKRGMYVRTCRRRGAVTNPGVFYQLTDGRGDYWEAAPENLTRVGRDE